MVLTIRHWSVKPLNKGHLGDIDNVPYSEVICYNSMGQNHSVERCPFFEGSLFVGFAVCIYMYREREREIQAMVVKFLLSD